MDDDDWTIADTKAAAAILDYLGIGSEVSKEPAVDRRRDAIAKIVRARVDYEVAQEREGCAFAAECHSGFGDPSSIEACAALIRGRADEPEDCIHVPKDVYARLISAQNSQKMTVKPLKWAVFELEGLRGCTMWDAPSVFGPYSIERFVRQPNFSHIIDPERPYFCFKTFEHYVTLEEAKAEAQKDYEKRLLAEFDISGQEAA